MHGQSYRLIARHKVWLEAGTHFVLGDGGIGLLRAIAGTGSIRAAASEVGWSYRHALAYLDNAERTLGFALIDRARGGNERGGTQLTPRGRDLLHRFTRFRAQLDRALDKFARVTLSKGAR